MAGKAVARTVGRLQRMTVGLNRTQAHTLRRITNGETVFPAQPRQGRETHLGPRRTWAASNSTKARSTGLLPDSRLALPDLE